MSYLERALKHELDNNAGWSAVCGTRLYPNQAPQNATKPYATYFKVSGFRTQHMTGPCGLASPRMQFDIYADTYGAMVSAADALRKALDGMRGSKGDTGQKVEIRRVMLEDESDEQEPPDVGDASGEYHRRMDFLIWHEEATS